MHMQMVQDHSVGGLQLLGQPGEGIVPRGPLLPKLASSLVGPKTDTSGRWKDRSNLAPSSIQVCVSRPKLKFF